MIDGSLLLLGDAVTKVRHVLHYSLITQLCIVVAEVLPCPAYQSSALIKLFRIAAPTDSPNKGLRF